LGANDYGTQNVIPQYKEDLTNQNWSRYLHDIIPVGVFDGLVVSQSVADPTNTVDITAGKIAINDQADIRYVTCVFTAVQENASFSGMPGTTGTYYLICRYTHADSQTNYVDILLVATPTTNDVILCSITYNAGSITAVDNSVKTLPSFSINPIPVHEIHAHTGAPQDYIDLTYTAADLTGINAEYIQAYLNRFKLIEGASYDYEMEYAAATNTIRFKNGLTIKNGDVLEIYVFQNSDL